MQKQDILSRLTEAGVVAVIRGTSPADALRIARECTAGGITAIELTFTVPQAHEALTALLEELDDSVLIGAGTVLDAETARIAILYGAKFIVSPAFDEATAKLCNRYAIPYLPGIGTVSEAIRAMEAGADIVKLFPGELYGPKAIKALKGPLPHINVMPTGGVDLSNIRDWVKAGAVAIGVGGALTSSSETDIESVSTKSKASQFLEEYHRAKQR